MHRRTDPILISSIQSFKDTWCAAQSIWIPIHWYHERRQQRAADVSSAEMYNNPKGTILRNLAHGSWKVPFSYRKCTTTMNQTGMPVCFNYRASIVIWW